MINASRQNSVKNCETTEHNNSKQPFPKAPNKKDFHVLAFEILFEEIKSAPVGN